MRKHSLINGNGQVFNLTDTNLVFHNTSGYGFEVDDRVRPIGPRWIRVTKEHRQVPITGTITFYGEQPYSQYHDFAQFLSVDSLVLTYTPENTTYKKDVYVESLIKGEINKYGALDVSISLMPLTPWYREVVVYTGDEILRGNGFTFPVTWPVFWRSTESMTAEITSDSYMDSPVKITIYGPIENPKYRHYTNGVYAGKGEITYDVAEGNCLVIDSTVDPYRMYIADPAGNEIADIYQQSNFGTERFLFLKHGKNVINFSAKESADKVPIKVEAKLYYETV